MAGSTQSRSRLTNRQREILEFICRSVQTRGFPPSIREIGEAVGLSSSSTVHSHLRSLESKGFVRRNPSKPRSIEVLDGATGSTGRLVDLPVGVPGAQTEKLPKVMSLPYDLAGDPDAFLYPVEGEGLAEEAIVAGDLLIVSPRSQNARSGDLLLLRDQEGGLQLQRLSRDPVPTNGKAAPGFLGRVVGLIRRFPGG